MPSKRTRKTPDVKKVLAVELEALEENKTIDEPLDQEPLTLKEEIKE